MGAGAPQPSGFGGAAASQQLAGPQPYKGHGLTVGGGLPKEVGVFFFFFNKSFVIFLNFLSKSKALEWVGWVRLVWFLKLSS